ncbi:alanine racemase [Virgibacillus oceani]|uniref:Alanine racemase n=1 Tax=Virgibacillus oceani TaxID=1479511 RepID=A0A917H5P3_9BACI|nr:alanine racemase [Virgibacillus oceani]GGG68135.1 alanine racemase [Virgibacillus oceani]
MLQSLRLSSYSPTIAEIDLKAFRKNIQVLKKHTKNNLLLAVIKTNAYGHGIVPIGHEAIKAGADRLGVSTVEEGAMLRESGITAPIHILSTISPMQVADVITYSLVASISSLQLAKELSREATLKNRIIPVHLKIDTGLHRFGVDPDNAIDFCTTCYHQPGLNWEGIYTHFSRADEGDWVTTGKQFALFMGTVQELKNAGFTFSIHHVGGSTITIEREDMRLDMIRPGIALFGYHPALRQRNIAPLKSVMKLKSQLLQIRELPPNTAVGYGGNYVTTSTEKIAVVPIGLGDGYKRSFSNNGEMLVKGIRAKIVGTVSLDQTLIDVTHIPGVEVGDEVVVMGKQGNDEITAREMAGWMNSIVDEVLASMTQRIRRVYV